MCIALGVSTASTVLHSLAVALTSSYTYSMYCVSVSIAATTHYSYTYTACTVHCIVLVLLYIHSDVLHTPHYILLRRYYVLVVFMCSRSCTAVDVVGVCTTWCSYII